MPFVAVFHPMVTARIIGLHFDHPETNIHRPKESGEFLFLDEIVQGSETGDRVRVPKLIWSPNQYIFLSRHVKIFLS